MKEIYLDNAATTRPWPEVIEAMRESMSSGFGNASSLHRRGVRAARRIDEAKEAIVSLVGSGPWEVVFTSGGSESDNLAVFGSVPRGRRTDIVTTTVEHAAITEACRRVCREKGGTVREVSAGESGLVSPVLLARHVEKSTALVAVNHVANEMGTVQQVTEVARLVKARDAKCRVHVDGVQALAQLPLLGYPGEVDTVAISAHKIHGPQGIGALLIRPGITLRPMIAGGDQQGGARPGTLNLPGIVGFAKAAEILRQCRSKNVAQMGKMTDLLISSVFAGLTGVRTLGDPRVRAPGIAILAVDGVQSEVVLHALEDRGVFASSGSACHATRKSAPPCLVDAGLKSEEGAVRLSLSFDTTQEEVERAAQAFIDAVKAIRQGRTGVKSEC